MPNPKGLPMNPNTSTDVSAYLPGPAVGLGIDSVNHTGSQGLDGWGATPKDWRRRRHT